MVNEQGQAEFRPVKVGPWYEDQWYIDEGLKDGDVVVVDGALRLRAGVQVKIVEPDKADAKNATPASGQADAG